MSRNSLPLIKSPQILAISIVTSELDPASQTIYEQLLQNYDFQDETTHPLSHHPQVKNLKDYSPNPTLKFYLIYVKVKLIDIDEYFDPDTFPGDLLIFGSRHQSESGKHGLLCHTPGNFSQDNHTGGSPNHTAAGSGLLSHYLFMNLCDFARQRNFPVPIDHEVNHHGPTEIRQPIAFIEQGSIEEHWKNPIGAKIIADSIIRAGEQLLDHFQEDGSWDPKSIHIIVGFGGGHYMPSFSKLIPKGYGFAHTIPKYKIMDLNSQMMKQVIDRTLEPISSWVFDWKGLNSAQKAHLMEILAFSEIPIKKAHRIRHSENAI